MGNYYTRIVRIYPKSKSTKLDKVQIAENVVKTALLDYELNVYDNEEENCIDLCWRSKRAGGDIPIDFKLIDVWEIRGGDYTQIFFNGKPLSQRTFDGLFFFRFDELEINYANDSIEEILIDIFPHVNPNNRLPASSIENTTKFRINGIYRADNDYVIGTQDNKINYLDKKDFLALKGTTNLIDGCISNESKINSLTKVIKKFYDIETGQSQEFNPYPGLTYFQLNYENRPVVQIHKNQENKYEPWLYKSSNWWDNCITPEWIEYKTKKTNTHGNM